MKRNSPAWLKYRRVPHLGRYLLREEAQTANGTSMIIYRITSIRGSVQFGAQWGGGPGMDYSPLRALAS